MKIAILMSTYNGQNYLTEQLDSLYKQTLIDNITLYIRDDGSTDNTLEIIEEYKSKMKIKLYEEENCGPAMSFWALLNKDISADYFLFCDQDDIWDSDKVEKSIIELKNGSCLAACNCRIINSIGLIKQEIRLNYHPIIDIPHLFISGFTQGCSLAFTCELRDYVVKCNIKCVPMHDIIMIIYALVFGKVTWIEDPLFSYRIHEKNVVAKNTSVIKRLKTTIWNWKNSAENSMSDVAWELLQNGDNFTIEEINYLKLIVNYRKSILNKIKLIQNNYVNTIDHKAVRSYRIRLLLNLF